MAPHFTVDLWNLIWSIWVTGESLLAVGVVSCSIWVWSAVLYGCGQLFYIGVVIWVIG